MWPVLLTAVWNYFGMLLFSAQNRNRAYIPNFNSLELMAGVVIVEGASG